MNRPLTPKQQVLERHPDAHCVSSNDARCCYVIVADGRELGESHGGRGRAWRDAAAKLA